ncbi:MAG: SCO family protein [Bacteroidota bacterium]
MRFHYTLPLLIILSFPRSLGASEKNPYGLTEQHGNQIPDVTVFTEDSIMVNLRDLINRPTILSFVYFDCPGLCIPLLEGLAEVIDRSDSKIGEEYHVLTISIDADETPFLARAKKQALMESMQNTTAVSHWKFLTLEDQSAMEKLSEATGYHIKKENGQITHVAAVILLTPDAKISQYLYGTFFMPMHWSMAIDDAAEGKTVPSRIKNLKYCYNYVKPSNPNVVILARFFGGTVLTLAVGLFLYLVFFPQKRKETVHDSE